jgi:hypothetical protein
MTRVLAGVLAIFAADAATLGAQPAAGRDAGGPAIRTFDGRSGDTTVPIPRIEGGVEIDGDLSEAVWDDAPRLTGFSRYAPVDGAPADDPTEVQVWYSPTAIHFGIRAVAAPGAVRATLADRDRIQLDDHILIFLSTFNDQRQATVFGVNPLGVQLDGVLVEGTRAGGGGFGGLANGRESPDLSPDFVFESKGRVTDTGYDVELRIPFKSLRYQTTGVQDWGLQVTRVVPDRGTEDSWTAARREEASFLAQAGRLTGLRDLRRGLVLDLNPVATAKIDGAASPGGWSYDTSRPEVGLNVRWGLTANLTMNGTVNPDFSQVEADAGQFQFDPRSAIFFPEKRPFFLEGTEQFTTPNNLIYTRRIVAPVAATKLTGKVSRSLNLAVLSALDDETTSATGRDHPLVNIVRLQHDIGAQSRAALVYTDRIDGALSNRVLAADTRLVWRDVYSLQLQAGASRTVSSSTTITAPIWHGIFARTGRRVSVRYQVRGIDEDFRAAAGFISRAGIVLASATHQLSFYGPPGGVVDKWTTDVYVDGVWQYDDFTKGRQAQDRKLWFNNNFTFRGGWRAGASVLIESFGYDERLYRNYVLGRETAQGVVFTPFTGGRARLPNRDIQISFGAPQRKGVSVDGFVIRGKDDNFFEWASANILFANVGVAWRPTEQLRVDTRYQLQSYQRRTDGSIVSIRRIPRVKVEYQLARPVFVRFVGEYDGQWTDDLRDDSRTDLPIFVRVAEGTYERAVKAYARTFRADWLFSYQPTPGTVVFAGYSSSLANPNDDPRQPRLRRAIDGWFLKWSHLWRL